MRKTDFFTQFTQKQLPIHDKTKNRLNTLSQRLPGGVIRGTNEIQPKNKMDMRLYQLIERNSFP